MNVLKNQYRNVSTETQWTRYMRRIYEARALAEEDNV